MKSTAIILTFLLLPMLSACQSVDVSPSQTYRPKGSDDLWRISGNLNSKSNGFVLARELVVNVNGEEAIRGSLSQSAVGELSGQYKNHSVHSICSSEMRTRTWLDVRCVILIDNERAVTLTF